MHVTRDRALHVPGFVGGSLDESLARAGKWIRRDSEGGASIRSWLGPLVYGVRILFYILGIVIYIYKKILIFMIHN
jgi:hypothetical protein